MRNPKANTSAEPGHKAQISEREIRDALLMLLSESSNDGVRIQEELRLERGSARIDVAVIGSSLVGYEIKSDADTFARFANQIHAYNRIFDEIHLVCGERHLEAAKATIPSWWGIFVARRADDGDVVISLVRAANPNSRQDSFSLASMLWRDEALAMIDTATANVPKKASSHMLWEHIASTFSLEAIRSTVSHTLLRRPLTPF